MPDAVAAARSIFTTITMNDSLSRVQPPSQVTTRSPEARADRDWGSKAKELGFWLHGVDRCGSTHPLLFGRTQSSRARSGYGECSSCCESSQPPANDAGVSAPARRGIRQPKRAGLRSGLGPTCRDRTAGPSIRAPSARRLEADGIEEHCIEILQTLVKIRHLGCRERPRWELADALARRRVSFGHPKRDTQHLLHLGVRSRDLFTPLPGGIKMLADRPDPLQQKLPRSGLASRSKLAFKSRSASSFLSRRCSCDLPSAYGITGFRGPAYLLRFGSSVARSSAARRASTSSSSTAFAV